MGQDAMIYDTGFDFGVLGEPNNSVKETWLSIGIA